MLPLQLIRKLYYRKVEVAFLSKGKHTNFWEVEKRGAKSCPCPSLLQACWCGPHCLPSAPMKWAQQPEGTDSLGVRRLKFSWAITVLGFHFPTPLIPWWASGRWRGAMGFIECGGCVSGMPMWGTKGKSQWDIIESYRSGDILVSYSLNSVEQVHAWTTGS